MPIIRRPLPNGCCRRATVNSNLAARTDVGVGSSAALSRCPTCVRFPPDLDQIADVAALRFRANFRLMHRGTLKKFIAAIPLGRAFDAAVNFASE